MADACDRHPDYSLVESILAGSLPAWHCFVNKYTALICSVLRRHLRDEENVRSEFAQVLMNLRRGKLEKYEGNSALSTWLVIVVRRHSVDVIRKTKGRWELPACIRSMPARNQRVYHLYFIEGRSLGEIRDLISHGEDFVALDEIIDVVQAQLHQLSRKLKSRLDYGAQALRLGGESGFMLEYTDELQDDVRDRQGRETPEHDLFRQETSQVLEKIKLHFEFLSREDRNILKFRFDQGLSVPRIAAKLDIENPRRVHTLIDRAVARLRNLVEAGEPPVSTESKRSLNSRRTWREESPGRRPINGKQVLRLVPNIRKANSR